MQNNIITQITDLLKNAGIAPELMQKAMGLMDGIDITDIAGIMPELSKLGLPPQVMDQIQGFMGQQVMNNIPGGDMIGSMMKGNMPDMMGKISDSMPKDMNIPNMPEVAQKSKGFLSSIMGMFGGKK